MLFWIIEFFLFIIFVYIYFICPSETYYMYSSSSNNAVSFGLGTVNLNVYTATVLLCVLSNVSLFFRKFSVCLFHIVWLLLFYIHSYLVLSEFSRFRESIVIITNIWFGNGLESSFVYSISGDGLRTFYSCGYLPDMCVYRSCTYINVVISIIKFWHVAFIYVIFYFISYSLASVNLISNSNASINLQNSFYLFIFTSLPYVYEFGRFVKLFFTLPYGTCHHTMLFSNLMSELRLVLFM